MSARGTYRVNEDGLFTCVRRLTSATGALVTQATVASITLTVTQQAADDETTADATATPWVADPAPVVASTIFNTAQTNEELWPTEEHPEGGYNFLYTVPAAAVPVGGVYYNAEFTLTMSDGGTIQVPFRGIYTEPLLKS